jgi:hypothetical protein
MRLSGVLMRTAMFVALILLSPLTILVPFSNSAPVATTYVTSERTTTATYTSTTFHTSAVSTTGTMMLQSPMSITPQVVGFMTPKGKCSQFMMPLNVNAGSNLNLQLTSTKPANLYLLSTAQYQTSPNGCDLIGSSLLAGTNFTSYTLQWTATEDGEVYLLLTGPNTIIMLRNHGSTESVEQLATVTRTSTEASLNAYSLTKVANYTTSTTSASQAYLPLPLGSEVSFVAFLIALLGPILLLISTKRFAKLKGHDGT